MTNTTEHPALESATRRLVDGFDSIPQRWLMHVANAEDEEVYAWPMWGTCFRVGNMDRSAIERLMRDAVPTDLQGLIQFMDDHGIDPDDVSNAVRLIALSASDPDEIDEDEIDDLRTDVYERWTESDDEDALLCMAGWQDVGETGIIAREIDGELILGINGAGYDFYASHWIPLYKELGYQWHHSA